MKHSSWDNSVGIATGHGLDGRGSIPGKSKRFVSSRPALGATQPTIQWVPGGGALSPEVNRPERERGHSLMYSVDAKNGEAIPPLPHTSSWRGA
jgi:hypothetical protein